jgi:hypothetical protein
MAQTNPRARRPKSSRLLAAGLIVVAVVALLTTLVLVGAVNLPFLKKEALAGGSNGKDHGTDIPIPICARPIQVFNVVQPQDLNDPQTGTIKVVWVDPAKAKQAGFFTQYAEVVGRVLKHDKSPGYAFTEADFYPKGALPTPANAVEQGKLGMYVDPAKISGLGDLKRGDVFDLLGVKTGVKDSSGQSKGTQARSVVSGGKVIMALRVPENGRMHAGDQMYIQVSPQEVVDLQAALAAGDHISCATRPGIAGVQTGPLPIPPPTLRPDTIEILSGKGNVRREEVPSSPEDTQNADSMPPADSNAPVHPGEPQPKKKNPQQGEK